MSQDKNRKNRSGSKRSRPVRFQNTSFQNALSRQEQYKQKLKKLLEDSDNLDAEVVKNTRNLISQMRVEIIAKTAEAQANSQSGVEPGWGPYWLNKLKTAYNEVVDKIGHQFQMDLSKYSIKSADNGQKLADEGLRFAAPGINISMNQLDPEQLKIASSFSADLITRMKQKQVEDISKQVALSLSMRETPSDLIRRISVDLDSGPWKTAKYRAELIARTEMARIQELARDQKSRQLERQNPGLKIYYQFIVAYVGDYPCQSCYQYDGNVYDADGNPYIIAKGKKPGPCPDLPIHPGCRCTKVPYVVGLSREPEVDNSDPAEDDCMVRWNKLIEAWTAEFHSSRKIPIQTIRLPLDTDLSQIKTKIYVIGAQYGLSPFEIDIKIESPQKLYKPVGRDAPRAAEDIRGTDIKESSLSEPPQKKSRWAGVPKSYHSWRGMKDRTLNPLNKDYHRYGSRGIGIHPSWHDYRNFVRDMGEPPDPSYSLDRIDNNKDYGPDNCKWVSKREQALNRSTSLKYKNSLNNHQPSLFSKIQKQISPKTSKKSK
jgi:hypothetical protein